MERVRAGRQPGTSGRITEEERFHFRGFPAGHHRELLTAGIRMGMRVLNGGIRSGQDYSTRSAQV